MLSNLLAIFTVLSLLYSAIANDVCFKNVHIVGTWGGLTKFDKIILSSNNLKENLPNMTDVRKIELSNDIPNLYNNSISDIDYVEEIEMNDNHLHEIQSGAFRNLPKLLRITINFNQLKQIKEGIFNDLSIRTLDLGYNGIEIIENGAFDNMTELRKILLYNNKITQWNNNWFKNTPNLITLDMTRNQIEEIPAEAFKNLEIASNTRLPTIDLCFNYNKINKIDQDAFKHLKKIENLNVEGNEIKNFNENWLDGIEVHVLDVTSNNMNCLHGDYDKIFSAKITKIDENPWSCDCLENITNYMSSHPDKVEIEIRERTCKI